MSTLGQRIKSFRQLRQMTQEQLATELNTTKTAISRYESDKREPNLDTIEKISSVLNVDIGEILLDLDDAARWREIIHDADAKIIGISESLRDKDITAILEDLGKLNDSGWLVAKQRINELTMIPIYQRGEGE